MNADQEEEMFSQFVNERVSIAVAREQLQAAPLYDARVHDVDSSVFESAKYEGYGDLWCFLRFAPLRHHDPASRLIIELLIVGDCNPSHLRRGCREHESFPRLQVSVQIVLRRR